MRIVLEPGSYSLENVGDVGMLQIAVRRLRNLWPGARVSVVTEAPQRLASLCPETEPILVRHARFSGGLWRRLRRGTLLTPMRPEGDDLAAMVRNADLLVVSGMGGFTDAFAARASRVLGTLALAESCGVPAALLSQGMGPVEDSPFKEQVGRALAHVDFIALRERLRGPALLAQLGVPPGIVRVTGDDAIELAYQARAARDGTCLGINVRVAAYAGVDDRLIDSLRTVLRDAAARLQAQVLPVPISHRHQGLDAKTNRALLRDVDPSSDGGAALQTPLDVIRQIGRCRLVVAGSYHAGVFALAQGIPVVGLVNSRYYSDKFHGLADMFGCGCEIVHLGDPEFPRTLADAIDRAWACAPHDRQGLLAAAVEQVGLGHQACRDLLQLSRDGRHRARRHVRPASC